MLLKRIKLENIRSYDNINIDIPKGSVLLSGDIGSGKTTILLAIEFALFGLQPGQKGASLLKNGRDDGLIELEFEIDEKRIVIARTLKRKKTITQDFSSISIDGRVTEKAVTEIKNDILTLLNYPLEFAKKTNLLYRFTVYTPQEEMKQIIFENPEIRLNTLRHVFGIDKYKRIRENSVILSSRLRELSRIKQAKISDLDSSKIEINNKKNLIKELQKQIPEINLQLKDVNAMKEKKDAELKEVKSKIDDKRKMENEIEKANIILLTKKDQLIKNQKDNGELRKKIDQASKSFSVEEFDKLLLKIKDNKLKKEKLNNERIDLISNLNSLSSKVLDLSNLKDKISNLKTCPTCLQDVSDNHRNNILIQTETGISKINKDKINIDNEKQKKDIEISSLDYEIEKLERSRSELEIIKIRLEGVEDNKKKVTELDEQKIHLEKDITLLSEQIDRLRDSVANMRKYDTILLSKEQELTEILARQRDFEIKRAELVKEIEISEFNIKGLENEIKSKEAIKSELNYVNALESWVSSQFLDIVSFIEKNVMIKLREEFSKLFSEWFSILVPEDFIARLNDDFTPLISQQGFELDYEFLSGGEKTAVALAYRLALNQTINSILSELKTKGIVILDEPTDGFSEQQLDKMRDVLQELNVDQLIIVSHDQKIESFVDNIIKLKKQDGVSGVVG